MVVYLRLLQGPSPSLSRRKKEEAGLEAKTQSMHTRGQVSEDNRVPAEGGRDDDACTYMPARNPSREIRTKERERDSAGGTRAERAASVPTGRCSAPWRAPASPSPYLLHERESPLIAGAGVVEYHPQSPNVILFFRGSLLSPRPKTFQRFIVFCSLFLDETVDLLQTSIFLYSPLGGKNIYIEKVGSLI